MKYDRVGGVLRQDERRPRALDLGRRTTLIFH